MSQASNPRDTGNQIGCEDPPRRYIEVQEGARETWRIMYGAPEGQDPAVHARLGARVRFQFQTTFHSDQTARFLLMDAQGPVMAIEKSGYSPKGFEAAALAIGWGPIFGRRPTGCGGTEAARALRVDGDTAVSVPPGQVRPVVLRGQAYHFCTFHSVNVLDRPCVDGIDLTSWILWRD